MLGHRQVLGFRSTAPGPVPNVVDTALLGMAIVLVWASQQYLFHQAWPTATLMAPILYILRGQRALRPAPLHSRRAAWLALTLCCAAHIVAVAISIQAIPRYLTPIASGSRAGRALQWPKSG
ncbi:SirB2 family protein [Chitinimonas sp.]|uniref:SirB2 family protein n=1 Tax=Chitinimonas sp. TaxID=1934313 RepID=UPI0039C8641F